MAWEATYLSLGGSNIKCIILAAGPTLGGRYGFPPDSKPKCLFHYKGKVILEHTVGVLRRGGIDNIRVVTGYKSEMIEKFNKEGGLGLTLIYNPDGADDKHAGGWKECHKSIQLGLEGVNDDVIITVGDLWLRGTALTQLLESEERLVVGRGGHGLQMFKIGREHLPKLRRARGRGCLRTLYFFCMVGKGVKGFQCENNVYTGPHGRLKHLEKHWVILHRIRDIDWYWQTDEGKKAGAKER